MEIVTKSAQETFDLGKKLAGGLRGGEVLALTGPLGAGKTVLVQGLAWGLGVRERVISPSYVLMREHELRVKGKSLKRLYHVDFYRLEDASGEVATLGLPEIWSDGGNIVVIEWAEKGKDKLPERTKWIEFSGTGEGERRIKLEFNI